MAKDVIMPVLGMNQDTAVLLNWLKREGDRVEKGEPIMEVETDKATMELDAPATGTLANVTAGAGEEVRVGSVIALILADGEEAPAGASAGEDALAADSASGPTDVPAAPADAPATSASASPPPRTAAEPSVAPPSPSLGASAPSRDGEAAASGRVPASPKARRLAAESGVALAALRGRGSGPEGAVLAADVLRAASEEGARGPAVSGRPAPAPSAPLSLEREVDAAELVALATWARERVSPEVTAGDLLVRLTTAVWDRFPPLSGMEEDWALAYHRPVAHDAEEGSLSLVTAAQRASLSAILASRQEARGSGAPERSAAVALVDLTDSRLDRVAGLAPQAPVTVVAGSLRERVTAVDGALAGRTTLPLTFLFDAAQIDLGAAATWADRLVGLIETPSDLLVLY